MKNKYTKNMKKRKNWNLLDIINGKTYVCYLGKSTFGYTDTVPNLISTSHDFCRSEYNILSKRIFHMLLANEKTENFKSYNKHNYFGFK